MLEGLAGEGYGGREIFPGKVGFSEEGPQGVQNSETLVKVSSPPCSRST